MDFDKDGKLDYEEQRGPVIHAPLNIKAIIIYQYHVEWLNLSKPKEKFYDRNHMVMTMRFIKPQIINSKEYMLACISMELGIEKKVVAVIGQEVCSSHISILT
jgi:hypothetical protein